MVQLPEFGPNQTKHLLTYATLWNIYSTKDLQVPDQISHLSFANMALHGPSTNIYLDLSPACFHSPNQPDYIK